MILYYVHDPMCSWCWGFHPTWLKILKELPKNIQVKYLLGGLAPDSDELMPEEIQLQIASYWEKIQQHIPGTAFNFDFWKVCQPRRSTYPACRAVIATRNQETNLEKDMIRAIQKAYYLNAQNPSDNTTLINLAHSLGLDAAIFHQDLNSNETQQQLEKEIMMARRIGAQGFPSMILESDGRYHSVPLDYNHADISIEFITKK